MSSFGTPSGGDQTGETEGKGSRPGDSEAPGHFFRKRKRGYHRAYDRGEKSYEVLRFMCTIQSRRMINDLNKKFFAPQMKAELEKPFGLPSILNEEKFMPKRHFSTVIFPPTFNKEAEDHMLDSIRYSMVGMDFGFSPKLSLWKRFLSWRRNLWR